MIEFITPALANYRMELFEKLNTRYSVKFLFTLYRTKKEFGGLSIPKSWNYETVSISNTNFFGACDTRNWLRLARALLTDRYELILSSPAEINYNLLAFLISKLRRKKIIFWGESWYWPSNKIAIRIFNNMIKWILEHGDAIIATGEKQYLFYLKMLNNKSSIFYAPKYVIPYRRRDAAQLIKDLAIVDSRILGRKIILYMSQIVERKGLDYLIRAFRLAEDRFDNIYLLVVGSGPFEDYCKRLARELGVKNIMFKGYVSDSDIESYHNVCSLLVLPSVFLNDYPEPNGYVLYESMSVGKPLVVTDAVGAAPEFVRNGVNGLVVKERNITELFDALSKILADETLQVKMGVKSKEIFEEKVSLERQFEAFKTAIDFVQTTRLTNSSPKWRGARFSSI